MQKLTTLIQVTPQWMSNGIFAAIATKNMPWTDAATVLDLDYYGNRSGQKITSPLVDLLLVDGVLQSSAMDSLADVIVAKYGYNWGRMWDALHTDYNPLDNYSLTEHENREDTGNEKNTGTVKTDRTAESENTVTTNNNTNITNGGTIVTDRSSSDKVFGYNSTTGKDNTSTTGKDTVTDSTTQNTVDGGTQTTDYSDTTSDTRTDNTNRDTTMTVERKLTRSGITGGNYQDMLERELEVRKQVFFDYVFDCVDKILTSPIYI